MKPFNLEEYLKNPSRKVVTRDGRNVRIICTDRRGDYPVIALIGKQDNDEETLDAFTEYGRWALSGKESANDLFFTTEKHEGWINLYRCEYNMKCCISTYPYDSEERAIESGRRSNAYIKTIKIEWEE